MRRARVAVLCDNQARPGFAAEWGLGLWIETPSGCRVEPLAAGQVLEFPSC